MIGTFSSEGRERQSRRMRAFADFEKDHGRFVVCDFVCPTAKTRDNFDADIPYLDGYAESSGRFEDTNKIFENPNNVDFHITEWNERNYEDIAKELAKVKKVESEKTSRKTITWRLVATIDTFLITLVITGKLQWALNVAGIEVLTKMLLYYFHERIWYEHIRFGVRDV